MNLGELIKALEAADQSLVVPWGFHQPHSFRGYYDQLAFRPTGGISVADMLAAAKSALGATFQGYKGGDYTMDEYTECWIAAYGESDGETIGQPTLRYMLTHASLTAENERLRKRLEAAWDRGDEDANQKVSMFVENQKLKAEVSSLRELESAARALFAFYDVWQHQIVTYDPGDELISDGVRLTNISALIDVENYRRLEDAADRIVVQEAEIRALLDALPPTPPATEGSDGETT